MRTPSPRVRQQRGAAVVEFALLLPVLMLLLYGLATFGAALYAQMAISRAAEDGARAAGFTQAKTVATIPSSLNDPTAQTLGSIQAQVIESLANSAVVPGASYAARRTWLLANVLPQIKVDGGSCGGVSSTTMLRVSVSVPFSGIRIIPNPTGYSSWTPTALTGCAILQLS